MINFAYVAAWRPENFFDKKREIRCRTRGHAFLTPCVVGCSGPGGCSDVRSTPQKKKRGREGREFISISVLLKRGENRKCSPNLQTGQLVGSQVVGLHLSFRCGLRLDSPPWFESLKKGRTADKVAVKPQKNGLSSALWARGGTADHGSRHDLAMFDRVKRPRQQVWCSEMIGGRLVRILTARCRDREILTDLEEPLNNFVEDRKLIRRNLTKLETKNRLRGASFIQGQMGI